MKRFDVKGGVKMSGARVEGGYEAYREGRRGQKD
jgi:hypothetical protein